MKIIENAMASQMKTSILELANELLEQIIAFLYNKDLVSFAMTCKLLHGLARVALREHQQLMRQWTTISNLGEPKGYLASRIASQITDSRIASYIHHLEITLQESGSHAETATTYQESLAAKATSDDLASFVIHRYGPGHWELWKTCISRGDADFILADWCHMLLDIKHLSVRRNAGRSLFLHEVLRPSPNGYHNQLRHLQSAQIDGTSDVNFPRQEYRLLEYFAQLPSLRKLSVTGFENQNPGGYWTASKPFVSNVKHLCMENCKLDTRFLTSFLHSMQVLEHFSYIEPLKAYDWHEANLGDLVTSLKGAAIKSLKTLTLLGRPFWELPQGDAISVEDLGGFEALQAVTIRYTTLVDSFATPCVRATKPLLIKLPISLKTLKVWDRWHELRGADVEALIEALGRKKREDLCQLQELEVSGLKTHSVKWLEAHRSVEKLGTAGVAVTFRYIDYERFNRWDSNGDRIYIEYTEEDDPTDEDTDAEKTDNDDIDGEGEDF